MFMSTSQAPSTINILMNIHYFCTIALTRVVWQYFSWGDKNSPHPRERTHSKQSTVPTQVQVSEPMRFSPGCLQGYGWREQKWPKDSCITEVHSSQRVTALKSWGAQHTLHSLQAARENILSRCLSWSQSLLCSFSPLESPFFATQLSYW